MNKLFVFGLVLISIFVLSCEKDCPEQDVDSLNALYLDFRTTGDNSFDVNDLEDLFMVRFLTDSLDTLSFQADTFHFNSPGDFYAAERKIRISKNIPQYDEIGAPFYSAYNYSIQSESSDIEVLITAIDLVGGYDSENCIYTNTKKTFAINGDTIDVTGSTEYILMGPN